LSPFLDSIKNRAHIEKKSNLGTDSFAHPVPSLSSVVSDSTVSRPFIRMSPKQQLQNSLGNIKKSVTGKLHSRLATIQSNDLNLAKQTKALHSRTQDACKHQDHWNRIVGAGRNGMKVWHNIGFLFC